MNVAVTRARRHLTIVGDSSTVCHDPFLRSLVEYINAHGEVWSAEQYRSQITGNTTHTGMPLLITVLSPGPTRKHCCENIMFPINVSLFAYLGKHCYRVKRGIRF